MSLFKKFTSLFRVDTARPQPQPDAGDSELVRVDIVGEASYQRELGILAGPKTEDGVSVWKPAELVPEPNNPYDPQAVVARIEGYTVGYLSRAKARAFHRMMAEFYPAGEPLTEVKAEIRGGWLRAGGDEGYFGVALYVQERIARRLEDE